MKTPRSETFVASLWILLWMTIPLLVAAPVAADEKEGVSLHALTDAKIVVAPGKVIENGTVVIRDGVLEAVGSDVEVPPGARVWDLKGEKTIYPGLIEPYLAQQWPEVDPEAEPQGGHENMLVRPERDISLHLDAEGWAKYREAGYTTAMVVPAGRFFNGRSAVTNLGDGGVHANLLRRDVAQGVTFRTHPEGGYPDSLMGGVALFRQTLYDARWYTAAHKAWDADPAQARPAWNTALEALAEASVGEQALLFETDGTRDTLRISALAEEFGLDVWIVGHGREYERVEALAALSLPHLIPLDFPDAPAVGDEGDALDVSLADLRHWDAAPENLAKVLAAGVTAAVTTSESADPKEIHGHLATAITRGLTPEQALAAVTTTPAALLGLSERLGTVEAGKAANLVIVEGDLFAEKAKINAVWIDGRHYELKESKPPEVDPAGAWELTIDAGDTVLTVRLELVGTVENLSGSISAGPASLPLSSVGVSGKIIEFSFDGTAAGFPGTFQFQMTQDGEKASGSGDGPPGEFTFAARRISKPEVDR